MVGSRGIYRAEDDPEYLDLARLVSEEGIGGVIWFLSTPLETADLNHRLAAKAKLPLLVAADLEAGPGMRFPDLVSGPSAMAVAAAGDLDLAERRARATAEAARALGIHVVFAPVADVNNNPDNPVINVRSFGEEPDAVGRFVAATVKGLQSGGVVATLKHFPGHGDTATDSHRSLPVLAFDRARLDAVELVPFRAGLRAGARSVMTGHLAVPALDATPVPVLANAPRTHDFTEDVTEVEAKGTLPATLSHALTTKLLREELGFDGLVFTDAMTMGGVVAHFETGEAAVRVLAAGGDVVLMPPDAKVAIAAIVEAVKGGRLPEARLDQAVGRLLAEKERLGLFREKELPLQEIARRAGTLAQKGTEEEVARRGLTLVREVEGAIPFRSGGRLLALAIHDERTAVAVDGTLQAELKKRAGSVDYVRLDPTSRSGRGRRREGGAADAVLVAPFVRPCPARNDRDPGGREGGHRRAPRLRQAGRRRLLRKPLPPSGRPRAPDLPLRLRPPGARPVGGGSRPLRRGADRGKTPGDDPGHRPARDGSQEGGGEVRGISNVPGSPAVPARSRALAPLLPFALASLASLDGFAAAAPPPPLETVAPESVGLSPDRLARIDDVLAQAIAKKEIPGAVVLFGRHGKVAFRKAHGHRALPLGRGDDRRHRSTRPPHQARRDGGRRDDARRGGSGRLDDPVVTHLPASAGGGERRR
jgi:beta-glucosidase-like glycosyl hydrolase